MTQLLGAILSTADMDAQLKGYLVHHTLQNVSGLALAATKIDTTRAGQTFHPMMTVIQAKSVSVFTSAPALSIGTNSSAYDNIKSMLASDLVTLSATGKFLPGLLSAALDEVAAATDLYVKVNVVAIATTYTFNVSVIGFYL